MFYLSGKRNDVLDEVVSLNGGIAPGPHSPDLGIGLIMQPITRNYTKWAHIYPVCGVDNGCFTEIGRQRFNMSTYLVMIKEARRAWGDQLLFATAPDVVGDWAETKRQSLPELKNIRKAGCPAALVLQNGATVEEFDRDNLWDRCDALFIGGDTEWKLGPQATRIVKAARLRGRRSKWIHMGRVNSLTRMKLAYQMGCDSADGTYLLHMAEQEGVANMVSWLREIYRLQNRDSSQ